MTETNSFRKIDAVDRLTELRLDLQARKGAGSGASRFGSQAIVPFEEDITVEDAVTINPNNIELDDEIQVEDAVDVSIEVSGGYQICDEDGTGTDNTQPGLIHFSDIGNDRGTGASV